MSKMEDNIVSVEMFDYMNSSHLNLTNNFNDAFKQLSNRDLELQHTNSAWQEKYSAVADKLTKEVNKLKVQIAFRDAKILSLDNITRSLSQMLTEATSKLSRGNEEQEKIWQDKYNAMKEMLTEHLAEKEKWWESQRVETEKKMKQLQEDLQCKNAKLSFIKQQPSERLEMNNKFWQSAFNELKSKVAEEMAEKQLSWEDQLIDYQIKVAQLEEQLHQKATQGVSSKENFCQTEATSQLSSVQGDLEQSELKLKLELKSKGEELQQANQEWQEKFKTLQEKFAKELAEKKCDCHLSKQEELSQSNKTWQEKYTALEEMLAIKEQSWETQLIKKQNEICQVEEEIQQKNNEILDLNNTKQSLSLQLTEATNQLSSKGGELLENNKAWQVKYNALEDKLTKELDNKYQSWQTKGKELEQKLNQATSSEVEELQILSDHNRQTEKKKEKKKGFFQWLHKKFKCKRHT